MTLLDLTKKTQLILEKRGISNPPKSRVGLAIDISGSMMDEYQNGLVQKTVDRILAIAQKFDDNGEIDVWTFHNKPSTAPVATAQSFGNYVKECILDNPKISKWGGTSYAPVLNLILDHYYRGITTVKKEGGFLGFGAKKTVEHKQAENVDIPALMLFITDGDNDDKSATDKLLEDSKTFSIYWQLVGVSNQCDFKYLKKKADELPNVGFAHLPDLNASDEVILEALITPEFTNWIKNRQQ